MRQLTTWGWPYVLRQTAKHRLRPTVQADCQRLDTLPAGPGQQR